MEASPRFESTTPYVFANVPSVNCPNYSVNPDESVFALQKVLKANNFANKKKKKKSVKFGSNIFPTQAPLGLPSGTKQTQNLTNRVDYTVRGARLPRPFGPRDNARMPLLQQINGFGTTPGTPSWKNFNKDYSGQEYANQGVLKPARAILKPQLLYFQGQGPNFNLDSGSNVPMNFSDNALNTPLITSKSRFGSFGKNNVGYEPDIPMYHAGGTTYNFATNSLYRPIGIVGGPTNSVGKFASMGTFSDPVTGVRNDGRTPRAFLGSSPKNLKFNFGSGLVYTPEIVTGPGLATLYQPEPDYLSKTKVSGSYVSYGSKKSIKRARPRLTKKSSSSLKQVSAIKDNLIITFNKKGKFSIKEV